MINVCPRIVDDKDENSRAAKTRSPLALLTSREDQTVFDFVLQRDSSSRVRVVLMKSILHQREVWNETLASGRVIDVFNRRTRCLGKEHIVVSTMVMKNEATILCRGRKRRRRRRRRRRRMVLLLLLTWVMMIGETSVRHSSSSDKRRLTRQCACIGEISALRWWYFGMQRVRNPLAPIPALITSRNRRDSPSTSTTEHHRSAYWPEQVLLSACLSSTIDRVTNPISSPSFSCLRLSFIYSLMFSSGIVSSCYCWHYWWQSEQIPLPLNGRIVRIHAGGEKWLFNTLMFC